MRVLSSLRLCIVGAGPGGLYVAERLFKRLKDIRVDVFDKLPFPFGLVETGVAPDHAATKNVRNGFLRVLERPRCRFYGNLQLGRDLRIDQLTPFYHAVILSCGAEADRKLGVEGEEGEGIYSARDFVWWYNGHPDGRRSIDLSKVGTVVIVGAGNVAIDCARLLLKPWDALTETDMAKRAIEAFKQSSVKEIYILARRGAAHVKFTPKELREIVHLSHIRVELKETDLNLSVKDQTMIDRQRSRKRVQSIFCEAAERSKEQKYDGEKFDRRLHFQFSKRIDRIELDEAKIVRAVWLKDTSVDDAPIEKLETELVINSIGTVSLPIEGVPFDRERGRVLNDGGRVVCEETGKVMDGIYVSGWMKRGASGIIGTNVLDAEEVTEAIVQDASNLLKRNLTEEPIDAFLKSKGVRYVDLDGWKRLREMERSRGRERGKEREKVVDREEMLKICEGSDKAIESTIR